MAAAAATLFFLVLYPLFWLFYGSFTYGDHGLSHRRLRSGFDAAAGPFPRAREHASAPRRRGAAVISIRLAAGVDRRAHRYPAQRPDRNCRDPAFHHAAAHRRGRLGAAGRATHRAHQSGGAAARRDRSAPQHLLHERAHFRDVALCEPLCFFSPCRRSCSGWMRASRRLRSSSGARLWRNATECRAARSACHAILSAAILVFTRALEEFAIPGVLGTPAGIYTVTTYIYYQAISYVPPRYEIAALLASLFMAVTAILPRPASAAS